MKLVLQYLNSSLIVLVALRQTGQLVRHRSDLALRVLTAGLVALAIAATINIQGSPVKPLAVGLLGAAFGTLVNSLWMTMAYCFAAFFLLADRAIPHGDRVRTAQREFLLLLAAIVTCALLPTLFPQGFSPSPGTRDYRSWQRIVYDLAVDGTGVLFVIIGLFRARRYLRMVTHTWLKWSVMLVCIGALGKGGVAACTLVRLVLRIIEDVDYPKRYPVVSFVYLVSLLGGQTALAIGLVLPTLAAGAAAITRYRARRTQSRRSRRMEPLWRALTEAMPCVVLPGPPEGLGGALTGTFQRRLTEITDALAQLAPYYAQAGLDPEHAGAGVRDPNQAASIILAALRAQDSRGERGEPPFPRIEPDHATWRERSQWMVATSQAFEQIVGGAGAKASATI